MPSSDTYRGPSEGSEPETQAIEGLFDRIDFRFQVELPLLRAVAPLPAGLADRDADRRRPDLLRAVGQQGQPRDRRLHSRALVGRPLRDERRDDRLRVFRRRGTISWTPELSTGLSRTAGSSSRTTRRSCRRSSTETCRSRSTWRSRRPIPPNPVSHLGITTKPFYLKSDDTYKFGLPEANFVFDYSYGDPQPVQVLAMRSLGDVTASGRSPASPRSTAHRRTSGAAARSTTSARAATTTSSGAMSPEHRPR